MKIERTRNHFFRDVFAAVAVLGSGKVPTMYRTTVEITAFVLHCSTLFNLFYFYQVILALQSNLVKLLN